MVELRRARSLVAFLHQGTVVACNFLERTQAACDSTSLAILCRLDEWVELSTIFEWYACYTQQSILNAAKALQENRLVVIRGSLEGARDEEYENSWHWGLSAGLFHFSTNDQVFVSAEAAEEILRERIQSDPSPALYDLNDGLEDIVRLPLPKEVPEPFYTMSRRRTNRLLVPEPMRLDLLADCLLFSLGITGILSNPLIMDLPLKMTPSGGARNPFEAYVCARRVDGLVAGTYHYSAYEKTLGLVNGTAPPPFPDLLAGQDWTEHAAAIIFLVACFERPMWKYRDPGALRVTLIEAGHIGQNIILAATAHGVTANPTCAISTGSVQQLLGVNELTRSVVYALVMGPCAPLPEASDEIT